MLFIQATARPAPAADILLIGVLSHAGPDGNPVPNWQGYLQMTGKRVTLVPVGGAPTLPPHPVGQLTSLIGSWQQ